MPASRQRTRLILFTMLFVSGSCAVLAQAPVAAAPPPATGFAFASLRPPLANVQTTVANLSVARWKVSGTTRSAVEGDISSMQRDLNATLPGLFTQAENSGPGMLSPSFALFRNLDALYDVLLRVTETAALAGPPADASSLEDARAGLEDARGKLGTWLLQSIGAQDGEVARLKAQPAQAAAPPAAPTKTVIEDGPEPPKPRKKKPAPAPAPQ
jgi:hypothetical protein